jgi:hypothetical protein
LSSALVFWFSTNNVALLAGISLIAGMYVAAQEALESTVTAELVVPDTLALVMINLPGVVRLHLENGRLT